MSFFTDLLTEIETEAKALEAKIAPVAQAFEQQIIGDIEIAAKDLAQIAVNAVLAQASATLSGSEKFGQAVTNVIQTIEAAGKGVAISTAQTAVQQAYSAVQSVASGA